MPTTLVTGANRGLGLELARQYAADGWRVHACCREPDRAEALASLARAEPAIAIHRLDVTNGGAIEHLADSLQDECLDLLINNAGIYGRKGVTIGDIDPAEWMQVLVINTIAPAMVAQAFLPQLLRAEHPVLATISSKVGSLADNSSGRNYPYRSSKAAANQVIKSLSIDLRDRGVITVALHPGWVQTDMGGPSALISAKQSVEGMRRVLAGLGPESSGRFFAFDGQEIPW
jgi:NAD(P)-dependent dehydrogenase (short-subunit alcohol dehydrogenase family)